jgi:hypothetical protein
LCSLALLLLLLLPWLLQLLWLLLLSQHSSNLLTGCR